MHTCKAYLSAHRWEAGIFLLALLLRVGLFTVSYHAQDYQFLETISGADGYFTISRNLVAGNGYSAEPAAPYVLNSIRPPVQPYFLAGMSMLFGGYAGPLALQILMGSIIPLLGIAIARYLTSSRRLPLLVGGLLALEPLSALFSFIFYPETIFTFLLLLAVLCIYRYIDQHRVVLLGYAAVLLGLATLAKPTAQYLPLLVVAVLLWHYRQTLRREWPRLALFLGVFALVLSPWVYRNWTTFGAASVSPQLGTQLYIVLMPSVLSMANGTTFAHEFDTAIANGGADPTHADIAQEHAYIAKAVPALLAHPKALAIILANTGLNFFIHDGVFEVLKHAGAKPAVMLGKPALFLLLSDPGKIVGYIGTVIFQPTIFILFARVFWIVTTGFFVYGAVQYLRRHPDIRGVFAIALVGYFMLTTLVIGLAITGRYRIPVNAFIFTFALYGAATCIAPLRRHLS